MVIRLHGVECHVCGLPADFWVDGVTVPCLCGATKHSEKVAAFEAVREHLVATRGQGQAAPL